MYFMIFPPVFLLHDESISHFHLHFQLYFPKDAIFHSFLFFVHILFTFISKNLHLLNIVSSHVCYILIISNEISRSNIDIYFFIIHAGNRRSGYPASSLFRDILLQNLCFFLLFLLRIRLLYFNKFRMFPYLRNSLKCFFHHLFYFSTTCIFHLSQHKKDF